MHALPASKEGTDYFKLNFDEYCLSHLPRLYSFLIDPYNNQKITFTAKAAGRLRANIEIFQDLPGALDAEPELLLSYLNKLLTEINIGYFAGDKNPADNKQAAYIRFKRLVEERLMRQLTVPVSQKVLALALLCFTISLSITRGILQKSTSTTG